MSEHLERDNDRPSPRRITSLLIAADRHLRMVVMATMLLVAVGAGIGIDRLVLEFTPAGAQRQEELADLESFQILEETYNIIREDYVLSEDFTEEDLIYGASRGMVDALGDEGHSRFLDPEEAEAFELSSRGELVGIGIQVDTEQVPPRVIMPIQNSPAFEAGIQAGDLILSIDGVPTEEFADGEESINAIRGEEGTDVTMELIHEGEVEPYEVTLTRARITVESISWAMLPDDVLWVRISEFSSGTTEGLKTALQEGKALGARGVILDLRANPGGLVFEAIGVGSQFQPDGSVLFQEMDAEGETREVSSVGSAGEWQDGPLVVLIDGDSASAAEITSSSIENNDRGILIGQQTFGTGTVLLPMELSDGSTVLIGTEMWLSANGEVIWKKGVPPTIEIANEPGVQVSLPFTYDGNEVTSGQFAELEDDQLLIAFDEITQQIRGESD
ncbi:MAG: S41 family peptidase [Thermomicrobiales bacterium]